jgi:hypothetical protein
MAQEVSRRPFKAEARVRTCVSPCGICGGQSGTGKRSSVFSRQYHSTVALHHLGREQQACCWPQLRDTVSPRHHEQHRVKLRLL